MIIGFWIIVGYFFWAIRVRKGRAWELLGNNYRHVPPISESCGEKYHYSKNSSLKYTSHGLSSLLMRPPKPTQHVMSIEKEWSVDTKNTIR
jgi:hypothetical protein